METINDIQDEIIEEFAGLDDWMDKYQLLIDMGNEQQPLPEQYKTEQNLIDGCQSRVWLQAECRERRTDCQGHRQPVDSRALRPYAAGNPRRRPLLHRRDRLEGAPLANAQQRPFSNGEANASLRVGFQRKALVEAVFLILINTRKASRNEEFRDFFCIFANRFRRPFKPD